MDFNADAVVWELDKVKNKEARGMTRSRPPR
jgi:hypothetical protein